MLAFRSSLVTFEVILNMIFVYETAGTVSLNQVRSLLECFICKHFPQFPFSPQRFIFIYVKE